MHYRFYTFTVFLDCYYLGIYYFVYMHVIRVSTRVNLETLGKGDSQRPDSG